ncbi:arabinogalactan endo-1,4-beta-galactosidase [Paraburkholderia sp. CI3]
MVWLSRHGRKSTEWVQIGNEITGGMLWPLGKYDQLDNLAALLKAGHDAVKSVDGRIKVMLHIDSGGNNATSRWWFDNMTQRGVTFGVIGLSYYPQWQGSFSDLQGNVNDLATRYDKDVIVVETAYPGGKSAPATSGTTTRCSISTATHCRRWMRSGGASASRVTRRHHCAGDACPLCWFTHSDVIAMLA